MKHPFTISVVAHKDDYDEINERMSSIGLIGKEVESITDNEYRRFFLSLEHHVPKRLVTEEQTLNVKG